MYNLDEIKTKKEISRELGGLGTKKIHLFQHYKFKDKLTIRINTVVGRTN